MPRQGVFALHVLFVCTGNICRSPTAERLAAGHGAQLTIPTFTTASAGIRAVVGHPIHPEAALVLESLGGTASGFAARQLSPLIANAADLILTMTRAQRDAVLERMPKLLNRTYALGEAARLAELPAAATVADLAGLRGHVIASRLSDVPDPLGRGPEFFEQVGVQIAGLLLPVVDLLRRSSTK